MTGVRWRNWAGTAHARPRALLTPGTEAEVAEEIVSLAASASSAEGTARRARAVGAGHSFTAAAATDGTMLSLDRLDAVEWVGPAAPDGSRLVRAGAGIRLHAFSAALAASGLAMENMGDIDRQTLAGAISTGTHGTGARLTGLSGQVRAVRLVTADGEVVTASALERPDLFEAARLGLGSVGVITSVTIRCVPAFRLRAVERPQRLGAVLESLDDPQGPVGTHAHVELYWFPFTDVALTKTNDRVEADDHAPLHPLRRLVDDELLSNALFDATNRLCAAIPALTPTVNAFAARALAPRSYTAPSHEVFVSPRRVVFREMEYGLPRAAVVPVLREVDAWLRRTRENVPFPLEVRFAASDDVWLSPAYGRDTAYVAVHQYRALPYHRYFRAVESIMAEHHGRPHWGKLHRLGADRLAELYPRFADFTGVRTAVDPLGLFRNPYSDRVLGRPGVPAGR